MSVNLIPASSKEGNITEANRPASPLGRLARLLARQAAREIGSSPEALTKGSRSTDPGTGSDPLNSERTGSIG